MKIRAILGITVLFSTMFAGVNGKVNPEDIGRHDRILGTYTGTLFANGYDMPVVTTFYLQGDMLCGEYVMDEDGTMTTGQFSSIEFLHENTIRCRWIDIYGTGPASFTFTDDFSGFAGYWSSETGAETYHWWGSREPLEEIRQSLQD